ncbi:MAG TPA: dolichyl-phosphate beta-glucosyltransferase [Blastocatellia bacterium]|nr:dolichyl-phosphate beta-glucosyltransferase [Blastocatellia bacterium]
MALLLSIVIPAYHEEKRIGRSLEGVLAFLVEKSYQAEVIVVDDGSKDGTDRVVNEWIPKYREAGEELRLLTNTPNRGKGYSVRRGLTEAAGEIVLFSDADFSSPISEAPKLIDPILEGNADVTFGSRALNRALIGKHQPVFRDFGGRVFNLFMRAITGLEFKDTQCGFKAFRRELALPVFQLQSIERFGFDPEVLYIARKRGLRLLEVPVVWNDAEGSTVRYASDSINMFLDLVRIRLNDFAGRYDGPAAHFAVQGQKAKQATKRL